MSKVRRISTSQWKGNVTEIVRYFRLVWRLLNDERISPWLKAVIPAVALLYVLLPVDLVPDLIPVLGQLDDLAIILLATRLFIELCPPSIVQEHLQSMSVAPANIPPDEEIIDATYRVIEEERS